VLATTCTSYVHKYPAPVQMVKVNPERPVLSCSEELIYRNMPMNPDSNMEEYGGISSCLPNKEGTTVMWKGFLKVKGNLSFKEEVGF